MSIATALALVSSIGDSSAKSRVRAQVACVRALIDEVRRSPASASLRDQLAEEVARLGDLVTRGP